MLRVYPHEEATIRTGLTLGASTHVSDPRSVQLLGHSELSYSSRSR